MAAQQQQQQKQPLRPFFLLGDILPNIRHADYPEFWLKVNCRRREAYGCGEKGWRIVEGLDLYTRIGDDDDPEGHPAIRIGASRDVLNVVGWEIDDDLAEIYGRGIRVSASVNSVDGPVMVLRISFVAGYKSSDFKSYCLVYDSTALGAFFLLPGMPQGCLPLCPSSPVKLGDNKFSVVLMVGRVASDSSTYPVLYLWSPPAPAPATGIKGKHRLDYESEAWAEKEHLHGDAGAMIRQDVDATDGFIPSLVFSYKGAAVWGDLGQGILYCDWVDLNVGRGPVDFKLNMLPLKCRAAFHMADHTFPMYRNMGCVGDSIWFVRIEPALEGVDPGETMVSVWTLGCLWEEWKLHREFKMQTIWDLDGFKGLRRALRGLPKTVPLFPFFRQQDDGILYMLLPDPGRGRIGGDRYVHLLGIDLSSSCEELCLLSPRRLVMPRMNRPLVLHPRFFINWYPRNR